MYSWFESKVLALSAQDFVTYMGVLLFALAFLGYYAWVSMKRYRFMDATATSRIRSAAQGYVELKGLGELLPEDNIVSPFSRSRCVWYHCTIDQQHRSGKRVTWTNITDLCSEHLFRLVDETGECIVDPDFAHVVPESEKTWYGHNVEASSQPPRRSQVLALGGYEYRFRERLIRPAASLYALGWFRTIYSNPSDEFVAARVEALIAQWKLQPQRYLRDFDFDQNGKIQKGEWKAIRAAARKQVLAKINQENKAQHVIASPEDKSQPYILSALPEENLVRRKKWLSHLAIGAGFLIFILLILMYSVRPLWTA